MLQQLLEKVALRLEERAIPYMMVGGQAVLLIHKIIAGRPRDLEDARIILGKNAGLNLEYIRNWLGLFEPGLDRPFLRQLDQILMAE